MSTLLDIFVLVDSSIPFEGVIRDNSLVFIFCDVTDFFADYHGMYDLVDRAGRKLFSGFSADVIALKFTGHRKIRPSSVTPGSSS